MRIRISERSRMFLERIRESDEGKYHSLQGLIITLSIDPEPDNVRKTRKNFGSGRLTPVYVDEDWWIIYRVEGEGDEETLVVISIWDAARPPHTRL